jgi:hypothetical protein
VEFVGSWLSPVGLIIVIVVGGVGDLYVLGGLREIDLERT